MQSDDTSSEDGGRVQILVVRLLRLLKNGHRDGTLRRVGNLIANRLIVRRGAGGALSFALALDEAIGDAQDGVDDDGIDAFGHLVLFMVLV